MVAPYYKGCPEYYKSDELLHHHIRSKEYTLMIVLLCVCNSL